MAKENHGVRTARLIGACAVVLAMLSTPFASGAAQAASPSRKAAAGPAEPIAAGWMYLADDYGRPTYDDIPATWSAINFAHVDVLYVGPFGIQPDGTFDERGQSPQSPLAKRLRWVVEHARAENAKIRIIASQWWGCGDSDCAPLWGNDLSALSGSTEAYAESVARFVQRNDLDGFDIDYEGGNVTEQVGDILGKVRAQFDALGRQTGRRYFETVSPAEPTYLDEPGIATDLDYVNIQTYEGGSSQTASDYTSIGFDRSQLLYGYCPETACDTPTLAEAEAGYQNVTSGVPQPLAGIHLWRLNSGNYQQENADQEEIYRYLHGGLGC
ncbi:hypothetical protein GCM10009738_12340 [Kitasatospora viridis]|uniref:glycosyl hydrolase family 18 protein n=1 Tax=Kitasatospora viridis TaxID=281105 RepID=UPI0031E2ABB2